MNFTLIVHRREYYDSRSQDSEYGHFKIYASEDQNKIIEKYIEEMILYQLECEYFDNENEYHLLINGIEGGETPEEEVAYDDISTIVRERFPDALKKRRDEIFKAEQERITRQNKELAERHEREEYQKFLELKRKFEK
jgi:hypothetical protein